MPIVKVTSGLIRNYVTGQDAPDPIFERGRVFVATGSVANAATDLQGSTYKLGDLPSECLLHSSTAFHVGGKAIYWYGIIIALGVLLALWFCMHQKEKYGITEDNLMDAVLWGIPLSIVGARLYYVIFYLDRFRREDGSLDWGKTVAIWDGGLAIYGAVIAAFLVGLFLSRKKGFKLGAMTDLVVMGFLIGQAAGRWGNFMNREAFGGATTHSLGARRKFLPFSAPCRIRSSHILPCPVSISLRRPSATLATSPPERPRRLPPPT